MHMRLRGLEIPSGDAILSGAAWTEADLGTLPLCFCTSAKREELQNVPNKLVRFGTSRNTRHQSFQGSQATSRGQRRVPSGTNVGDLAHQDMSQL